MSSIYLYLKGLLIEEKKNGVTPDIIKDKKYFSNLNTFIQNFNNISFFQPIKQCEQLYDLNNILQINFIGKIEKMDDDLNEIITILNTKNITRNIESYQRNKMNFFDRINEESFDFINCFFKDDFNIFNYTRITKFKYIQYFYDNYYLEEDKIQCVDKIYKSVNVLNKNIIIQKNFYKNCSNIIDCLFHEIGNNNNNTFSIKNRLKNMFFEQANLFIENENVLKNIEILYESYNNNLIDRQKCNKCRFLSFNNLAFFAHDYNCNKVVEPGSAIMYSGKELNVCKLSNNDEQIYKEYDMENIVNSWKIEYSNDENEKLLIDYLTKYYQHLPKSTILLDTTKSNFDVYEQFVYNTSMFHFNNLNITFDSKIHSIEFWFYNELSNSNLHFDKDETIGGITTTNTPLLSCITYLNDNIVEPSVITNVTKEMLNPVNLNDLQICVSFPKKGKQITFQGGKYYHGAFNIFNEYTVKNERKLIVINLWDKKTVGKEIYKSPENTAVYDSTSNAIAITQTYEKYINYLHLNNKDILNEFITKKRFSFSMKSDEIDINRLDIYKGIPEEKMLNASNQRFIQRFAINNFFNNELCNFFIEECEKYALNNGGWSNNRHEYFETTDLAIKDILNIYPIFLKKYKIIIEKIQKLYNIEPEYGYGINDAFIVKYDEKQQQSVGIHADGSSITVNILLNNANEFVGGGTYFEDGITSFLNKGDMLIHKGRTRHCGLRITKGIRYLLIIFIEIYKH